MFGIKLLIGFAVLQIAHAFVIAATDEALVTRAPLMIGAAIAIDAIVLLAMLI